MDEELAEYAPPPAPDPVFLAEGSLADIWIGKDADDTDLHTVPGKFYFWDETYIYAHGPYDTADEARYALERYCRWLETGEE